MLRHVLPKGFPLKNFRFFIHIPGQRGLDGVTMEIGLAAFQNVAFEHPEHPPGKNPLGPGGEPSYQRGHNGVGFIRKALHSSELASPEKNQ
jgi:hypothetical protein